MPRATRMPSDLEIQAFWAWFAGSAARLAAELEDRALLAELDARVSALGEVAWEVGPGEGDLLSLVISPDGVRDRLPATRHIIAHAPAIPGWELHPARPPKTWDLRFAIEHADGAVAHFDARPWRYALHRFPDWSFDLVVEQPYVPADEVSELAAAIVVDGVLGEAARLELIADIEPVHALPPALVKKATPIVHLGDHIRSLVRATS